MVNGLNAARVTDKAFCVAPAPDTIRGGLLSVFIEGNPAARLNDETDVGKIVQASADVLLGEWQGSTLTPFQAQWLYSYMAAQNHIPFEYATDGCFARADRMAQYMASLGIPVKKQWVWSTRQSGPLVVDIPKYPGGGVKWNYHVAPVVPVVRGSRGSALLVIDPSLRPGGPVTVDQWIGMQSSKVEKTVRAVTSPDVYFNVYVEETGEWESSLRSDEETAMDLDYYRGERANLPESSGRRISNEPVHY